MKNKHLLFKNVKTSFWKKINLVSYRAKTSLILAVSVFMMVATFVNPAGQKIFAADGGDSLVSAIKVQEIVDGVGPFDADDNPGNDSSANNKIVRSFDQIGYTLAYATALKTDKPIESGYLMCSFTLPNNKAEAQWDTGQMAWMEDPKVTTNADGSQTLTGKKLLKNTSSQNAIPGAGTLSAGIKVEGASNGTKISPTFKLWMGNNSDSEAKSVKADEITVSAAPKVDVSLTNSGTNVLGYYDLKTGNMSKDKVDGYLHGRMEGIGIGISMKSGDTTKKKKGLEIPTGDISFDLDLKEYVNPNETEKFNQDTNYQPVIWDYSTNCPRIPSGQLGRSLCLFGSYETTSTAINLPYAFNDDGDGWGTDTAIINGRSGRITITGTGNNKYHVVLSGYKFDTDNWIFPTKLPAETRYFPEDTFYFSANYMQVLMQFPENVTETQNLYLQAKASNIKATTASGQTSADVYEDNNTNVNNYTLYPSGYFRKDIREVTNASVWWGSDGKQTLGNTFNVKQVIGHSFDDNLKAIDSLFKFDTKGIEATGTMPLVRKCYGSESGDADLGTTTFLFVAKKDGTGWNSEDEMVKTKDTDLVFYKTLDDLKKAGKTCVGILYEGRNMNAARSSYDDTVQLWYGDCFKIKNNATPNSTYGMVADTCAWRTNISFERYGHDGEQKPTSSDTKYVNADTNYYLKAEYKNGTLVPGTHVDGFYSGNTIMAVGYKTTISKKITDKNSDGSDKTAYDIDNNERTVNYSIQPRVESEVSTGTTNLYITDNLPKDLTYKSGTAKWGNSTLDPEITSNSDGTKTLKWTLSNVNIGQELSPISFKCTIGKAGSTEDVTNNEQITNVASIYGDLNKDSVLNEDQGEISRVTFKVIKLASTSVQKSTDTPKVDIGQKFNYTFNFVNGSQNALKNVRLYDVFPYNGDGRNTNFNGSYKVTKISADFSSAPTALSSLADMQATLTSQKDDYSVLSTYTGWNNIAGTKSGTNVTWTPVADTKAIGLKFNAGGNEVVKVTVEFTPESGQKEGNSYINDIIQYADDQVQYVRSNRAVVQTRGNIKLKKIWDDDSNALKARPNTVDATIYQNNVKFKTVTLKSSKNWSTKLADVPVYDSDGNKYKYSVTDSVAHYATSWSADNDDPLNLTLTNKYKTHDVTLSKKVTGNYGDRDHEFTFNVKITNAVPGKTYNVSGSDKKTFTPDSSGNASISVSLKDGESAVFKDLPENATYQVSEAYEDYNASYAIDGANAVSGATSPVTTIKDNSSTIIYTNLREGVLPTGVTQHKKAIALVCAAIIALLTVIWYMLKKRHKEENKAK